MTVIAVPERMPLFDGSAAQTRATGSSIRLPQPLRDGVNHLLGWRKRRLIHLQRRSLRVGPNLDGSFWTYRHPNCDFLHFWLKLDSTTNSEAYVEIQAGTGDVIRIGPQVGGLPDGSDEYQCLVPWGEDSGYQEVTITTDDIKIMAIMAHELYSQELAIPPQLGMLSYDPTYPQAGLREGYYITESDPGGPRGIIKRAKDAWRYDIRQAMSLWRSGGPQVDVTTWTNPFIDGVFYHRARLKRQETTRAYRVYAWTYQQGVDGGGYYWRMSSTTNTVTSGLLTNTAGAWTYLTGLLVLTQADDTFTFEMRRNTATPVNRPAVVERISVIEEYV